MKIAILSDIHFGSKATHNDMVVMGQNCIDGTPANAKPFYSGLGGVVEILKDKRPDYLIISGDLTSTADPLEYKYCYDKLKELESIAKIPKQKWIVCLGNHDCDWDISELSESRRKKAKLKKTDPNSKYLQAHYMSTRTNDLVTHDLVKELVDNFSRDYDDFGVPMVGIAEFDDLIVFVLYSAVKCTEENDYGSIGNEQLVWLNNMIRAFKEKSELKRMIVLLHHHPHGYEYPLPDVDRSELVEGAALETLCGEQGIDIVVHGHRHHPRAETILKNGWEKPVTFICAGSLSVERAKRLGGEIPCMFHIMDCTDAEKIILESYSYSYIVGWDKKCTMDIDDVMWLGKPIQYSDAKQHIAGFACDGTEINHQDLPDTLRYVSCKKLNSWVKKVFNEADFSISDSFPHSIRIRRRVDLEAI